MFIYVGGYTTADRNGHGDGIRVYRAEAALGAWEQIQHIGGLENPSLFTARPDGRMLYAVHGARTWVSAFAVDPANGTLRLVNRAHCGGLNPVDAALSPDNRHLIVANYSSGNVAVLALAPDGALGGVRQVLPLPGKAGPDKPHQPHSYPHAAIMDPSGRFAVIPDKGVDTTFILRFDAAAGRVSLHQAMPARPGAAPRHCVFHPTLPVLYVNNELDSTVSAYHWDAAAGRISGAQTLRTIPADFPARNTTAEIAVSPDGRFLYVSNRGHDSIAIFAIQPGSGKLFLRGHEPTGGRTPRFFTLAPDGRALLVGNQDSHTITRFAVEPATGMLSRAAPPIAVGSPSAITLIG
jgi:6-phosphogluconolactonase (cycloisomerase 2 family)